MTPVVTPPHTPETTNSTDAPWRRCNLPFGTAVPGIQCGSAVAIIPFGGSINNNDLRDAIASRDNGIGKHLFNDVHLGLLGIHGIRAIGHNYVFNNLQQKDSSLLTRDDMSALRAEIERIPADTIVVAMGLYRATEVGRYLSQNLPKHVIEKKLIILTGSHDLFSAHPGDARFNIGYAHAQRFNSERGVRIAINSAMYRPEDIGIDIANRSTFFLDDVAERAVSPIAPDTLLIGLGGTIEGQELDIGQLLSSGFSKKYITETIRPRQAPQFLDLTVTKDSRELTAADLDRLRAAIRNVKQTEIIVTVGTWGAELVGAKLHEDQQLMAELERSGKRVVCAVACKLPTEQNSDAFYNLGFAFGAVPHLKSGVYLSVHGLISEIGAMTKIRSRNSVGPYFAPRETCSPL